VRCPSCANDAPPGSRFCNACGAPLAAGASVALADRPPRAYTPRHLVERILTSRAALEGERKQVTVLFADVQGSMDLAAQVDPERWHRLLDGFFGILADGIHRFEGTVNQFTGDGVMALFGAPIAHEDHAQRACWAALHLTDELRRWAEEVKRREGLPFAVRMGLNSGEVVVGRIGDDLRMDYTAQGHTVGLAARMEQLAEPGHAYLTEHTAALVEGFFRLRDLGPFTVKGVPRPLHVHALEGPGTFRGRLDVSRARGFSRFVGRAEEMAVLEEALAQAVAGQGGVVAVVAEAGVGKSRLCHEFTERCRARGIDVNVGRAVAHGRMIPFLPVLEILRGMFGIREHDDALVARQKVAGTLVLLDPELQDTLPLWLDFLGVPDPARALPRMDPEARQRRLLTALERLIRARARGGPGVLLVEDLHWLDAASEATAERVVATTPGSRTLIVLNFRPEYRAPWLEASWCRTLPLRPLPEAAGVELLRDLLGQDPSLAGLPERIVAHTGGNPFFTEEIVRALVEEGTLVGTRGGYRLAGAPATLALPASVQTVLAARIDRLPEREKVVLHTAAVIGREFAAPVLERVVALTATEVAAALDALVAAQLLYETAPAPEAEYAFEHPLTQEVAYRSQLAERRTQVHAAVASAIETAYAGRLDERAALLAHHWEGAGAPRVAAEWHRRAAEWVGARDRQEMVRHLRRVCDLVRDLPVTVETSALGVMARSQLLHNVWLLGGVGEEPLALFREGVALAAGLENPIPRILLTMEYGYARVNSGAVVDGLALLHEARRLADESGIEYIRGITRSPLGPALMIAGRLGEALAVTSEMRALRGLDAEGEIEFTGFSPYAISFTVDAFVHLYQGRIADSCRAAERAAELARGRGDTEVLILAGAALARTWAFVGERERALAHAEEALDLAEDLGGALVRNHALGAAGRAYLVSGRFDDAIRVLERSHANIRETSADRASEGIVLALTARARCGAGDAPGAVPVAAEAVAVARRVGTNIFEAEAQLAYAEALLAAEGRGRAAEIELAIGRAASLVEETGARLLEPFVHRTRGALARALEDDAGCVRETRRAAELFATIGVRAAPAA
jgi:class 3 adenylate cyclase/tetratricopeptide (TPR) repeat protein